MKLKDIDFLEVSLLIASLSLACVFVIQVKSSEGGCVKLIINTDEVVEIPTLLGGLKRAGKDWDVTQFPSKEIYAKVIDHLVKNTQVEDYWVRIYYNEKESYIETEKFDSLAEAKASPPEASKLGWQWAIVDVKSSDSF